MQHRLVPLQCDVANVLISKIHMCVFIVQGVFFRTRNLKLEYFLI